MIRVNMLKSRETMIKRKKNMKRTYIILVLSLMAIAVCKAQNNDSRWSQNRPQLDKPLSI